LYCPPAAAEHGVVRWLRENRIDGVIGRLLPDGGVSPLSTVITVLAHLMPVPTSCN